MVKENSSSSESLPKEERFVINMSSELIAYLCNDYSYRNPNRFSRLKALQDLLIRFQKAKLASKDMDVNIAQLVKAWGWSRPAVLGSKDFTDTEIRIQAMRNGAEELAYYQQKGFTSWLNTNKHELLSFSLIFAIFG